MKKLATNQVGQKKLTHFFTKKPQLDELSCKNTVDSRLLSTKNLPPQNNSNNQSKNGLKPKVEKSPVKKSVEKKTSPKKPPKKSPQKNSLQTFRTVAESSLKELRISPRKSQEKLQTASLKSHENEIDPENGLTIEGIRDFASKKTPPKKRKHDGSPLKEKQNGYDTTPTKSNILNTDCGSSRPASNSLAWGDEVDFIDLSEDAVVLSPKKILVKRQKCDEVLSNLAPKLEKRKSPIKSKKKEKDLSNFFKTESSSNIPRQINFNKLERYEVLNVVENGKEIQLTLKSLSDDVSGICYVRSPWNECSISVKDIISVRAILKNEGWVVDWDGLLVLNPDRLISGTTLVGSVYCTRKSVLSHLFKETGGTKDCMFVGSFVHELFQETMKKRLNSLKEIEELYSEKIKSRDFLLTLFLNNMKYDETVSKVHEFISPIHNFMQQYVFGDKTQNFSNSEIWNGQITEVEDIEENIWSPILGVKGKVDATVEVRVNKKNKVMPLELKTGKVSFSIEHRGQVILYCMLLQQLGRNVDSGLLLYLNSGVQMKEIKCEERETRDLTLLRNGLSHWLSKLSIVEVGDVIPPPTLPPPINRRTCATCPYLVPCSAALRRKELDELPRGHRMKEFAPDAIKHLTEDHMQFVFHWLGLLSLEKCSSTTKMSDIWSINSDLREKSGKCLTQMKMDDCKKDSDGGFIATLSKIDGSILETEFTLGQLLIISTESHLALALAVVKSFSPISLTLMLDKHIKADKPIIIDAYEGDSTFAILTNNLTCFLEDTPRASRLRELIIDRQLPTFSSKVSSRVKKVGLDVFERLNKEQVRAVLQAISSENYILIKGMPGTGKTTTMAALIEILTRLKKRVLVTSFTHSAIDNILINLVGKVKMLRLGPEHRVHPKLKEVTEHYYVKNLKDVSPAGIEGVFATKEVIGVTCYGCKHPWVERQVFDVCLVDEASQVTLPAVIKPISLAEKFILIGDPQQLPPLVLNEQAKELGLGKSLFEQLERPAVTSPLTHQYRMNSAITSLANDLTYKGQLQCANDSVAQATFSVPKGLEETLPSWLKESLSSDLPKSVIILDIKCEETQESGENKPEAAVVNRIIDALIKGGVEAESIGIIATYSRQVSLLKSMMKKNVEVNTVDQYQGRDKEIIIYSTTRSFASAEKKDILSDWSRLTVAITRAKKKLIILGNIDVLRSYENFGKLITAVPCENLIKVPLDLS